MKSKIYLLFFIFCVAFAQKGNSQNILKEDFETTSTYSVTGYAVPTGWVDIITWDPGIDQVNWQTVGKTGGVTAESGSQMAFFRNISLPITPGGYGRGYLETYPLDFTKDTAGQIIVTCWMYRDTVSVPVLTRGKVDVYVTNNEFPWDGSSALLGTIYVADSPFVTKNGWYEYRFNVPDSFKKFTSNYVLWWGLTDSSHYQYLDNISIDQFGADTLSVLHPEEDTLVCMGGTLNVIVGANHPFNTDNVFKVELSDSSGSFSSPTVIGKDSTDVLSTISCTLPSVMSTTKGYRIRIVSTSPAETSPDDGYDIHVRGQLNSTFIATSNGPICWGDTVKLTGSTTDYDITYTWTGPYKFLSNEQNPEIPNYKHLGTGTYLLTISRNGCPSVAKNVYLEDDSIHPALPTDSSNTPVCTGSTLKLYAGNTLSGGVYNWSGPDTFSSTAKNPTIANIKVSDSGRYYIYVQLKGCRSATDSIDIHVNATPAVPEDSSNGPVCVGNALYLYGKDSTAGVQYVWTGPGSFSDTEQNPVISAVALRDTGKFYVLATLNGCNSAKDSIQVVIKSVPASPSDSSNSPVCLGSKLELFSKDDTLGVTYSWTGPDSFASSVQNPTIATADLKDSGFYYVVVEKNGCLSYVDSINVKVKPLPANPSDSSNSPVCLGSKLELFSKEDTLGVTYSWTGPDSFTSSVQNPTIAITTLKSSGFYYVVTEKNGCLSDVDSINVKVKPLPANPSDSSNSPVCLGSKLELFSKDDTSGVTYSWIGPDSFTSSVQNPNIAATIAKDSGFYYVVAEKNGCLSKVDSIHVSIDSVIIPTVKISVSPDTLVSAGATVTFTATVTGGGTSPAYKWLKNGVVISGATTNTYVTNTLADKDVITAVVQSDAMCAMPDTALSNAIRIGIIPTNVQLVGNGSDITLYPNPNNGSFIIKGSIRNTASDKVSVEVLNMVGQVIYSNIVSLQNGIIDSRINLNNDIANGLYLLRLKADQQQDFMRFTLQR